MKTLKEFLNEVKKPKRLFNLINVTTNKRMAPRDAGSITHKKWNKNGSIEDIVDELDINRDDFIDTVEDGLDPVINVLDRSTPDQTVYFWLDK